jgi:hypothetical protein
MNSWTRYDLETAGGRFWRKPDIRQTRTSRNGPNHCTEVDIVRALAE